MSNELLYTPEEVAKVLKISRYTVYELIKRGDLVAYRIGRSMRIENKDFEEYKRKARSGDTALPCLVETPPDHHLDQHTELVICGQDVILDALAYHLEKRTRNIRVLRRHIGSISGLTALYNHAADITTAHLWDGDNDEYNTPYVRCYLPGQKVSIINMAYRIEGFYVAPGNPKNIHDWSDLTRPDVHFVNRERSTGTRVLLDEKLRRLDINPEQIQGYDREERNHLAVASCVARGEADVGLGTEKAAMQVQYVEFIPLHKEQFDLVALTKNMEQPHFQSLLAILRCPKFQKEVVNLGGYDISNMGNIVAEI